MEDGESQASNNERTSENDEELATDSSQGAGKKGGIKEIKIPKSLTTYDGKC